MIPVLFGPNYQKFQEAHDLLKLKAAFVVNNSVELIQTFNNLIKEIQNSSTNNSFINSMQYEYFKNNLGATNLIVEKIFSSTIVDRE